MDPAIFKCKQCNWQGCVDEVDVEIIETCSGNDKTEVCPSCGSMEVYLLSYD
jgi:Zn finger protein HypA/HybF involved in hydrogenase expression